MKNTPFELALRKDGFSDIAGIDEAGRGPWAGPLVSAAVILPPYTRLPGLNDSKLLSERKREQLFGLILKKAVVGVGIIPSTIVDKAGLTNALNMSYLKAIEGLSRQPNFVLLDGIGNYSLPCGYKTIKRGDRVVRSIAAASVVAKVTRDALMEFYDRVYPEYGFAQHKGYGTRQHRQNLLKYGCCAIHRHSFKPVNAFLND